MGGRVFPPEAGEAVSHFHINTDKKYKKDIVFI